MALTYVIFAKNRCGEEPPLQYVYECDAYGFADAAEQALRDVKSWCTYLVPKVGDLLVVKLKVEGTYKVFQVTSRYPWKFARPNLSSHEVRGGHFPVNQAPT